MIRTVSSLVALFLLFSSQALMASVSFRTDYWLPGAAESMVTLYKVNGSEVYQTLTTYSGGPVYTSNWVADPANGLTMTGPIFCIEIPEDIYVPGNQTYSPGIVSLDLVPIYNGNQGSPQMGVDAATAIRRLWGMHFADTMIDTESVNGISLAEKRGAFQLVLWELSYDHGISYEAGVSGLNNGLLMVTNASDELTLAKTWLTDALSTDTRLANLMAVSDTCHQDMVGEVPGQVGTVVPEPATLVIWSLLGMGSWLGMMIWRRLGTG